MLSDTAARERQMLFVSAHTRSPGEEPGSQRRKGEWWAPGAGGGRVSVGDAEDILETGDGVGCKNRPLSRSLKVVRTASFVFCVFNRNVLHWKEKETLKYRVAWPESVDSCSAGK